MARRMTDTEKWKREWFRKCSPRQKSLWNLICDECDHAGFMPVDWEMICKKIGEPVSEKDLAAFGGRIRMMSPSKLWCPRFIEFQYNVGLGPLDARLNPYDETTRKGSRVHLGVVRTLVQNGVDPTPWTTNQLGFDSLSKGYGKGTGVGEEVDVGVGAKEGGQGGDSPVKPGSPVEAQYVAMAVAAETRGDQAEAGRLRKMLGYFRMSRPRPMPQVAPS